MVVCVVTVNVVWLGYICLFSFRVVVCYKSHKLFPICASYLGRDAVVEIMLAADPHVTCRLLPLPRDIVYLGLADLPYPLQPLPNSVFGNCEMVTDLKQKRTTRK